MVVVRGAAAIAAAGSVWVLVTGRTPRVGWELPAMRPRLVVLSAVTGVVASIVALGLVGVPIVAGAVGTLLAALPASVHRERRRLRGEAVAASWPDVLARTRARLSGGSTMAEAFVAGLETAPTELARWAPIVEESVRYGSGLGAALDQMREDLADPIADRVTMTIAVATIAGGRSVGEALAALSASVADELRLRRAHHAAMTEQRLTAVVALVAPWALLALTLGTNPQAASTYRTGSGSVVVVVGLIATGLGYLLAVHSARLAEPPRVFR